MDDVNRVDNQYVWPSCSIVDSGHLLSAGKEMATCRVATEPALFSDFDFEVHKDRLQVFEQDQRVRSSNSARLPHCTNQWLAPPIEVADWTDTLRESPISQAEWGSEDDN